MRKFKEGDPIWVLGRHGVVCGYLSIPRWQGHYKAFNRLVWLADDAPLGPKGGPYLSQCEEWEASLDTCARPTCCPCRECPR